jgi:hypothetical protein
MDARIIDAGNPTNGHSVPSIVSMMHTERQNVKLTQP